MKKIKHADAIIAVETVIQADDKVTEEEKKYLAEVIEKLAGDGHISSIEMRELLIEASKSDQDESIEESMVIKQIMDKFHTESKNDDRKNIKNEVDSDQKIPKGEEESATSDNTEPESASDNVDVQKESEGDASTMEKLTAEENLCSTSLLETEKEIQASVKSLDLWYGDKQAIFDVSIPFEKNAVTALIGPSGCGKSTLLRMINRMNDLIPSCRYEGVVEFDEEMVLNRKADLVKVRKNIGMVFQKPNPFPKSIYENVAYGVRLHYKPTRKELDNIVENSLKRAAIWDEVKDRLHELGTSLSGGQQQRLCIARTIAIEPDMILMDEPCSALDPIATAAIEELILELKKDFTVVIVTHSMSQAARVSDYTGFMYLGRLIEFGKTEKLFSNPSQELTQRYITGRFG
tara:strand:- start:471 stop:1685 length:1215 start_codon:yes stop_codon:yes gene_type:complete